MSAHTTCLGPKLCESGHIVPISGPCPSCGEELLWGELVRRRKAAERRKEEKKKREGKEGGRGGGRGEEGRG